MNNYRVQSIKSCDNCKYSTNQVYENRLACTYDRSKEPVMVNNHGICDNWEIWE